MAAASLDAARFALDARGLNGLQRAAANDPKGQLKAAAQQFEAVFLGYMLKSMREAVAKSDLLDNRQTEFYQSLADQQLAQNLANKGFGLADMLVRQLSGRHHNAEVNANNDLQQRIAAIPRATPRVLDAAPTSPALANPIAPGAAAAAAGGETVAGRFVTKFLGAARAAAQASGMPAVLILAQAALETGWGKHQATAADGSASHNLFGIKAGESWNGAVAPSPTREFVAGRWLAANEPFRAYGSHSEAFADHARLIGQSPRYAAVRNADSPEAAARALQNCGYASDPDYADKLIAIMRQIGAAVGL